MGQKTHPRGFRLGIVETWDSKWYHEEKYADWLREDLEIQKYIKDRLYRAGISKIEIEKYTAKCNVSVYTARPGIVIGKRGVEIESLQKDLSKLVGKEIRILVQEIRRPELDAQLVAEAIALQIERRTNYKQAMKKAVAASMRAGAEGVKIRVAGRLGGKEIARCEHVIEGRVPLHTLRAEIGYGFAEANTKAGKIGVKVWIFKGEVISTSADEEEEKVQEVKRGFRRSDRDRRDKRPFDEDRSREDIARSTDSRGRQNRPRSDRYRTRQERKARPAGDRDKQDKRQRKDRSRKPRRRDSRDRRDLSQRRRPRPKE